MQTSQITSDKQQIMELAVRYAHALDSHAWADLQQVFSERVTMSFAHIGDVEGVDEIARVCSEALEKLDASQHLIGSVAATVSDDTGTCRSYFQAQHVKDDRTFLVGGTYDDTVIREAGGWRVLRRVQTVTWTSGDQTVVFD